MKKVLLIVFTATIVSSVTHAQIEKGTVLLGGNVNINVSKDDYSNSPSPTSNGKSNHFAFSPAAGIAIKQNLIAGVELGYRRSTTDRIVNTSDMKDEIYSSKLFLRRYFPVGKGFYVFAQPGVYFSRSDREYKYSASNSYNKSWAIGLSLDPGISYAVSNKFHLEAGLGNIANIYYNHSKDKDINYSTGQQYNRKRNEFSFSSSLSGSNMFYLGFRFFLPKKMKA